MNCTQSGRRLFAFSCIVCVERTMPLRTGLFLLMVLNASANELDQNESYSPRRARFSANSPCKYSNTLLPSAPLYASFHTMPASLAYYSMWTFFLACIVLAYAAFAVETSALIRGQGCGINAVVFAGVLPATDEHGAWCWHLRARGCVMLIVLLVWLLPVSHCEAYSGLKGVSGHKAWSCLCSLPVAFKSEKVGYTILTCLWAMLQQRHNVQPLGLCPVS